MKKSTSKIIYSFFICLIISNTATASVTHYKTPLEQARWLFKGDVFQCQITHVVTSFGEFNLSALPGSPLSISLNADWLVLDSAVSSLHVVTSPWSRPSDLLSAGTNLTWQQNKASSSIATEQLLEALEQGNSWRVLVQLDTQRAYQIDASPISTQEAVSQFRYCRKNLLPQPFTYVRRVNIQFESASTQLTRKHDSDLYAIARYLEADDSITQVLIDGHADASGQHLANLVLSKERADQVSSRLIELGVERQKIQVRHHGSRMPKAGNQNVEGRQINRRVSIRLIKSTNMGSK